ncbi:YqiA/YcfP family alpha/beta fold hydrolase [Psychrobacter sp. DM8]|uniref:YqiA/YcfP family alpha/beta fold hydrolase n=1 Tax=unclassified Psychrobacter TaxID=196806 RepID=UPI003F50B1BE
MNLVYIHGLDSTANSVKGQLLERYCARHHPDISVHRPDLNQSPERVFGYLTDVVAELSTDAKTVLVGSSLGGYFASIVSNHMGCGALLLNPSTQPHVTLQRFQDNAHADTLESASKNNSDSNSDETLYTTTGGWVMTRADLTWFADHQLTAIHCPDKVAALIKDGDELLDAQISKQFYQAKGATVIMQEGGDHRFSDFAKHLPLVIDIVQQLSS